jgi:hypothetical protein
MRDITSAQGVSNFLIYKRVAGIEPALLAWKAKVLPLNYTRTDLITIT